MRLRFEKLGRLRRQPDDEDGAGTVGMIARLDLPAVQFDELPDERKADTETACNTR
jgi:hypothetical protein